MTNITSVQTFQIKACCRRPARRPSRLIAWSCARMFHSVDCIPVDFQNPTSPRVAAITVASLSTVMLISRLDTGFGHKILPLAISQARRHLCFFASVIGRSGDAADLRIKSRPSHHSRETKINNGRGCQSSEDTQCVDTIPMLDMRICT